MNLKMKRLVRTSSSEQYALFDLDQVDSERQPMTIGKLDLHYTSEGVYGTVLLWDDASRQLKNAQRREFIQSLLTEVVQPMGVPNEYVVEFFDPRLDNYEVFHNVAIDDEDELIEFNKPGAKASAKPDEGTPKATTGVASPSPLR